MNDPRKAKFFCPSGHPTLVTTKQASGEEGVTCGVCGWHGSTHDGGVRVEGAAGSPTQEEEE